MNTRLGPSPGPEREGGAEARRDCRIENAPSRVGGRRPPIGPAARNEAARCRSSPKTVRGSNVLGRDGPPDGSMGAATRKRFGRGAATSPDYARTRFDVRPVEALEPRCWLRQKSRPSVFVVDAARESRKIADHRGAGFCAPPETGAENWAARPSHLSEELLPATGPAMRWAEAWRWV